MIIVGIIFCILAILSFFLFKIWPLALLFIIIGTIFIIVGITGKKENISKASDSAIYCSIGKLILLSIITLGIYQLVWIYRVTKYLNVAPDEEQYNPTAKLLLCMFVPFYWIYWFYRHGQRMDKLARSKNLGTSDSATMLLVLALFFPVIASIIMQSKLNDISTAKPIHKSMEKPSGEYKEKRNENDSAEALKKYKELLDSGIITQEEFDAKKKQLLGL